MKGKYRIHLCRRGLRFREYSFGISRYLSSIHVTNCKDDLAGVCPLHIESTSAFESEVDSGMFKYYNRQTSLISTYGDVLKIKTEVYKKKLTISLQQRLSPLSPLSAAAIDPT